MTLRNTEYLLSELLLTAAEKYPDRPALIFPDSQLTYSELSSLSQRYARAMIGGRFVAWGPRGDFGGQSA